MAAASAVAYAAAAVGSPPCSCGSHGVYGTCKSRSTDDGQRTDLSGTRTALHWVNKLHGTTLAAIRRTKHCQGSAAAGIRRVKRGNFPTELVASRLVSGPGPEKPNLMLSLIVGQLLVCEQAHIVGLYTMQHCHPRLDRESACDRPRPQVGALCRTRPSVHFTWRLTVSVYRRASG